MTTSISVSNPNHTTLPDTLAACQKKAEYFLDLFSRYTNYLHRLRNPYLRWLNAKPNLSPDAIFNFFNWWYPVSRHQPQILWKIMSAYPDWIDRHYIFLNVVEEDGHVAIGDNPHYDLLEGLIIKLGGRLNIDPEAEELVNRFHTSLDGLSPGQATGYLAAIEHPALDISDYFTSIATLSRRAELLTEDPYLKIHVEVEPNHIIWSHGNALNWIEDKEKQERLKYTKEDVISAFSHAMSFWDEFWKVAFYKLGYND